jgi:hypothetical protein
LHGEIDPVDVAEPSFLLGPHTAFEENLLDDVEARQHDRVDLKKV